MELEQNYRKKMLKRILHISSCKLNICQAKHNSDGEVNSKQVEWNKWYEIFNGMKTLIYEAAEFISLAYFFGKKFFLLPQCSSQSP